MSIAWKMLPELQLDQAGTAGGNMTPSQNEKVTLA
jgi:hypothetical protein